jgi:hypothetical protein
MTTTFTKRHLRGHFASAGNSTVVMASPGSCAKRASALARRVATASTPPIAITKPHRAQSPSGRFGARGGQSDLSRRHRLHLNGRRLALPRGGHRSLQPSDCRLGNERMDRNPAPLLLLGARNICIRPISRIGFNKSTGSKQASRLKAV